MRIGVIGNGFVGKATNILACEGVQCLSYDINPELCNPLGTTLEDVVLRTDIIFISVPTPMRSDGSCHLNILESVVSDINKIKKVNDLFVVIRSTVPPGTCDRLGCYFMPEFLTEKNYLEDFKNNKDWIYGLPSNGLGCEDFKETITLLINTACYFGKIKNCNIIFMKNKEAEMVKLFRNNFLAVKVGFCSEFYELCGKLGIEYDNVREVATLDDRVGKSHTLVPGPDGKVGFGGTCFPKDINNTLNIMKGVGMKSYVLDGVNRRNEEVDRKEKDWENNVGRTVV